MRLHVPEHERLLESIITGEEDPRAALATSMMSDCDECAERLDELSRARELLDELAEDARHTLSAAERVVDAPGMERVEAVLGPRLRAAAADARARPDWLRRVGLALAAAAAVLVFAYLIGGPPQNRTTENSHPLGGNTGVRLGGPIEGVDGWSSFEWEAQAGGWLFEVHVYPADDEGRVIGDALQVSARSEATTWLPSRAELRELPDRLRWELRVYDGSGSYVESIWADAWLGR